MRVVRSFRPYDNGDATAILDAREDLAWEYAAMGFPFDRDRPPGLAWTVLKNGRVRGVGGAVPVEPGVWRLWSFFSKGWTARDFAYAAKRIRGVVELLETVLTADRVELWACASSPEARRYAEALGFREGDPDTAPEGYLSFVRD